MLKTSIFKNIQFSQFFWKIWAKIHIFRDFQTIPGIIGWFINKKPNFCKFVQFKPILRNKLSPNWTNLQIFCFLWINHPIMLGIGWKSLKMCIFAQIFQKNWENWIFLKIDVFSKVLVFSNGHGQKILQFLSDFDEILGDCRGLVGYNLRKFHQNRT